MKRLLLAFVAIAAFVLGSASAAGPATLHFPIARNGVFQASVVTLVQDDTTFVGADTDGTGRVVLTYIDRAHGNTLHVVEDAGDHVAELIDPLPTQGASLAPQFVVDGPKQADGVPLFVKRGDQLYLLVYFTSRDDGDSTGAFKLKRRTMRWP